MVCLGFSAGTLTGRISPTSALMTFAAMAGCFQTSRQAPLIFLLAALVFPPRPGELTNFVTCKALEDHELSFCQTYLGHHGLSFIFFMVYDGVTF